VADERGASNPSVDEVAINAAMAVLGEDYHDVPLPVSTFDLDRRAWLDLG
jgi:hypothetical protein